jgi:hypothetical protein
MTSLHFKETHFRAAFEFIIFGELRIREFKSVCTF